MDLKKILIAIVLLGALAVVFGLIAKPWSGATPVAEQHVLMGTTTAAGNYAYIEEAPYYSIAATYPATTSLSRGADQKARLTIEQTLADRIAEFKKNGNFENLTAEDVELQRLGEDRKYALVMDYRSYSGSGYVSYTYMIYEDTLGAHPNGYFLTFTFDAEGNRVAITDVLSKNPNALEELSLVVSNDVVAQMKQRIGVDDVTGSLFAEGLSPKVENYSNFLIDADTLVILIPPYQVAAYAVGSFEVRVPLAEINQ